MNFTFPAPPTIVTVLALFVAQGGSAQRDDSALQKPPASPPVRETQPVPTVQPGFIPVPPAPKFTITERIESSSAREFASKLSDVLGVDVRIPDSYRKKLILNAGQYTAAGFLNEIALQLGGTYRQVFVFKPATKTELVQRKSKLASPGRVSLRRSQVPFALLARVLSERTGCSVEHPARVEGRFSIDFEAIPIEVAMADLAAKAGMVLSIAIQFEPAETNAERLLQQTLELSDKQMLEEQLQREEIVEELQSMTGQDPLSEDFPWDSLPDSFWSERGYGPEEVEELRNRFLLEGQLAREQQQEDPDIGSEDGFRGGGRQLPP
jgi:hypothetical protein